MLYPLENMADDNDVGQTDLDTDNNDTDDNSEDPANVGTIVWGIHGRTWYSAILGSQDDVPDIQKLGRNFNGKIIVK